MNLIIGGDDAPRNDSQELVEKLKLLFDGATNEVRDAVQPLRNALMNLAYAAFDLQFAEYEYYVLKKPFDEGDFSSRHAAVGRALERLKALADEGTEDSV